MDKKLQADSKIITRKAQWDSLAEQLAGSSWLALDTEFMRVRSYYPQLCLVQLANEEVEVCVDVLAFDCRQQLGALIADAAIAKIIHSASQDIEVLGYFCDVVPANIFDTQLAAEFAGYTSQMGYAAIVQELLHVELPKSQTRSDWAKRPLSSSQIEYSLNDVRYLKPIYDLLMAQLNQSEKLDWLQQEQAQELTRMLDFRVQPELAYQSFKSQHRLSPRSQHLVKQLINWREQLAQQKDLPKNWILHDKTMIDIAQQLPADKSELKTILKQDRRFKWRNFDAVYGYLQQLTDDQYQPIWDAPIQPTDAVKQQMQSLRDRLENLARSINIPTTRLATKQDVQQYLMSGSGRLTHGWRKDLINNL